MYFKKIYFYHRQLSVFKTLRFFLPCSLQQISYEIGYKMPICCQDPATNVTTMLRTTTYCNQEVAIPLLWCMSYITSKTILSPVGGRLLQTVKLVSKFSSKTSENIISFKLKFLWNFSTLIFPMRETECRKKYILENFDLG